MRNPLKQSLAVLTSLALLPLAAAATTVQAPHPGTVTALTYYTSGAFHGAVDISSGRCGYWGVQTGLVGSFSWNITIRNTATTCTTQSEANQNEAKHHFADGSTYRIWDFLKTANSYDRTCDRCQIGDEGDHTHIQYDLAGTKDTSWYSGYTTRGEAIDAGETIGVLP